MFGWSFPQQLGVYLCLQGLFHFSCTSIFCQVLPWITSVPHANQIIHEIQLLPKSRAANLRRLLRSFIYCVISSFLGAYLLIRYYRSWPDDLLFLWNTEIADAFTLALSHWIFSLYEDYHSYDQLNMVFLKNASEPAEIRSMYASLVQHHLITIFAYSWALYSHHISGLCVFGLCFEFPVILMSIRELLIVFDDVLHTIAVISFAQFRYFWSTLYLLWHIGRTIPCLHWPTSLLIWQAHLARLPPGSFYAYHFLGFAFNFANITLLFRYLVKYLRDDSQRLGYVLKREETAGGSYKYVVTTTDGTESAGSAVVVPPASASAAVRLMGPKEVALHASANDCFLIISNKVYDVTDFLKQHPGGTDLLLQHAGTDATSAFNETGHSSTARGLLHKYYTADLLAHGYDQTAKTVATPSNSIGDTKLPFQLFKTYFRMGNPVLPLLLCAQLSLRIAKHMQATVSASPLPALSAYVRMTLLAAPLLLLAALPPVQSYLHNKNSSWFGPQSALLSGRLSLRILLSWRVHWRALLTIANALAEISLVFVSDSLSLLRVALLCSSLAEFLLGDLHALLNDPPACSLDPFALLRGLVSIGENSNHRAQVLLLAAVALELVGVSSSDPDPAVYAAIAVAALSRVLLTQTHQSTTDIMSGDCFGAAVVSTALAVAYSLVALVVLAPAQLSLETLIGPVHTAHWATYAGQSLILFLCIATQAAFIHWSRPSFANHVYSLSNAALLWLYNPPVGAAVWSSFTLFCFSLQGISLETSRKLASKDHLQPHFFYSIKHVENLLRAHVSMILYEVVRRVVLGVLSLLAPYGYRFWAPPSAVIDLGDRCEYGMAYMVSGLPQHQPTVFQCNVGYTTINGMDVAETAESTRLMLKELIDDPAAGEKGFVHDLVAIFEIPKSSPSYYEGKYSVREVNLSGWTSEAAAYNWYKNSPAHKEIVKKYYNAGLEDFSALLAQLQAPPHKPMRWELRCRECRKVSSGPKVDLCPYCNSKMPTMPYF